MATTTPNVYFIDVHTPRANLVGIVAYLSKFATADEELTRFYTVLDGTWRHLEFPYSIVSLTFTPWQGAPAWWLLGKRGDVVRVSPSGTITERISDAGTGPAALGYLNRIRTVGRSLFACGYRRQVYKRDATGWIHSDAGALAAKSDVAQGFYAIDGFSENEMYAVGRPGELFGFDGTKWRRIDSPTNRALNAVRCASDGFVYVVGDSGTVLKGRGDQWDIITTEQDGFTLWAIEEFRGRLFIGFEQGVLELSGSTVARVPDAPDRFVAGHLHASEGALWAVGSYDIVRFDGGRWERVACPDNP